LTHAPISLKSGSGFGPIWHCPIDTTGAGGGIACCSSPASRAILIAVSILVSTAEQDQLRPCWRSRRVLASSRWGNPATENGRVTPRASARAIAGESVKEASAKPLRKSLRAKHNKNRSHRTAVDGSGYKVRWRHVTMNFIDASAFYRRLRSRQFQTQRPAGLR
jgi:hypothetical protein